MYSRRRGKREVMRSGSATQRKEKEGPPKGREEITETSQL